MKKKSFWITSTKNSSIITDFIEEPSDFSSSCLVKTLHTAISHGTETTVFSGNVPKSMYNEMHCPYMEGDFSFPIKYGYSLVGVVLEGIPSLKGKIVMNSCAFLHPGICLLVGFADVLLVII